MVLTSSPGTVFQDVRESSWLQLPHHRWSSQGRRVNLQAGWSSELCCLMSTEREWVKLNNIRFKWNYYCIINAWHSQTYTPKWFNMEKHSLWYPSNVTNMWINKLRLVLGVSVNFFFISSTPLSSCLVKIWVRLHTKADKLLCVGWTEL